MADQNSNALSITTAFSFLILLSLTLGVLVSVLVNPNWQQKETHLLRGLACEQPVPRSPLRAAPWSSQTFTSHHRGYMCLFLPISTNSKCIQCKKGNRASFHRTVGPFVFVVIAIPLIDQRHCHRLKHTHTHDVSGLHQTFIQHKLSA